MISFLRRWIAPQLLVMPLAITVALLMVYLLLPLLLNSSRNFSLPSFNAAGYRAKLVTGNMKMEERDDAISGLADGRTQVLCSVDVVSEGTMFQQYQQQSCSDPHSQKPSTSSKSDASSALSLEKSQLFWITLAALSNMALLMTFALGR